MKRLVIALVFALLGCISATSSTITVSGIAEPSAAIARIEGIAGQLGFHPVEPAAAAEKPGTIVKVYHTRLSPAIFVVVSFEPPNSAVDVYFAERADSFSILGLQKRDELMNQMALAFGRDRLSVK